MRCSKDISEIHLRDDHSAFTRKTKTEDVPMNKIKTLVKVMKCVIDVICYVALAIIVAVFVCFLFGIKPYVVMSGSMEPAIHTGSICFVNSRADYNKIETGDVIAFETALGDKVTHRAVAVTKDGIETKGDANDNSDGISATPANFCGRTILVIPNLGYLLIALQRPRNMVILGIIVVMMFVIFLINGNGKKEQKSSNMEEAQ